MSFSSHRFIRGAVAVAASTMFVACGSDIDDQAIDEILESALETTTPEVMSSVTVSPSSSVVDPSVVAASSTVTEEPTPAFFAENNAVHEIRDRLQLECDAEIADGDLAGNVNSLICTEAEHGVTKIVVLDSEADLDDLRAAFTQNSDAESFEIIDPRGGWVVFTHGDERAQAFADKLDAEAEVVELPEDYTAESEASTPTAE